MDSKKAHREIGFIGLGIMGKPMVKNLLKSGYKVSFFARRKKVIDEISAIGGIYIKNISDLPKSCKVIILNLPKSNDVHNIVLGERGLYKNILPDTTLIDMSTISPDVTVEIADKLKVKKSYMIDAPVSGGEIGAITGNLSIMVGGQKKVFNKILPILSVLGENITYIGKSGSGKSVLTKCIVGLLEPDIGDVDYDDIKFSNLKSKDKKSVRKQIGMLFQGSALFDSLTVEENVAFPLRMFTKMSEEEVIERVNFCLNRVNILNKNLS